MLAQYKRVSIAFIYTSSLKTKHKMVADDVKSNLLGTGNVSYITIVNHLHVHVV